MEPRQVNIVDDVTWKCCSPWGWVGEIFIRVLLGAIYGASYFFNKPFIRQVEVHDWPSYNYPHRDPESIAPWVVAVGMVVLPVFMITGVTLVGRFAPNSQWSRKYSNSNTQAMLNRRLITEWILAMLALSMGYLCNGVITDVVKNAYGRPRPDFLSRCFGPKDLYVDEDKKFWIALPTNDPLRQKSNSPSQNDAVRLYYNISGLPMGEYQNTNNVTFPYIEDLPSIINFDDCINSDFELIVDKGRRSFPSGHTSAAFAGAMFCALYSFHWLGKLDTPMNLGIDKNMRHIRFPGTSFRIGLLFLWFVPAFYVGISRTQDYRHHGTDIIAGAIVGSFSVLFPFLQYFDVFKPNRSDHDQHTF